MRPTSDTALTNPILGKVVHETQQMLMAQNGLIGLRVMPYFRVATDTGTYIVLPKEAAFNIQKTRRAMGANYNRLGKEFEEGLYKTFEHGLEYPIDDRAGSIYGTRFNYQQVIGTLLMKDILRAQEWRVSQKIFNTTNFPAHVVALPWDNLAADIKTDIDAGIAALRLNGIMPNTLILAWNTFKNMTKNTMILAAVKDMFPDTAKTGRVEIRHLETYFDLTIEVAGAQYNSAMKGKDATLTDIWTDDYAVLGLLAPEGSDISEPSVGRTIIWNEGATDEVIVEEYREEGVRGFIQRVRHDVVETFLASFDEDQTVKSEISKACGYLFSDLKT